MIPWLEGKIRWDPSKPNKAGTILSSNRHLWVQQIGNHERLLHEGPIELLCVFLLLSDCLLQLPTTTNCSLTILLRRSRRLLLHPGTVLVSVPLQLLQGFLRPNPLSDALRQILGHGDATCVCRSLEHLPLIAHPRKVQMHTHRPQITPSLLRCWSLWWWLCLLLRLLY